MTNVGIAKGDMDPKTLSNQTYQAIDSIQQILKYTENLLKDEFTPENRSRTLRIVHGYATCAEIEINHIADILKSLGIDPINWEAFTKYGDQLSNRGCCTRPPKEELAEWCETLTIQGIATKYQVPYPTVRTWLRKYSLKAQRSMKNDKMCCRKRPSVS